jgi:hypothetical protein
MYVGALARRENLLFFFSFFFFFSSADVPLKRGSTRGRGVPPAYSLLHRVQSYTWA